MRVGEISQDNSLPSEEECVKKEGMSSPILPPLSVFLCAPRGFCAGVVRAIDCVQQALKLYGPPVYVRHEIVHNKYVVESLRRQGTIFVKEIDEIPQGPARVIFSAHGVAKAVVQEAKVRGLQILDACCPLVTKVHRQAEKHYRAGREVVLIGHAGHPEVIGTIGQVPLGSVHLVETLEDVEKIHLNHPENCAYVTQTTLSVDDTREIIQALHSRFPKIQGPVIEDICYATTNRQEAVKKIAPHVEAMIVVGSENSSNSQRLREVAQRAGCQKVQLLLYEKEIQWSEFEPIRSLGLTAGASAPEILIENILEAFSKRYDLQVESVTAAEENVFFPLPKELRAKGKEVEG